MLEKAIFIGGTVLVALVLFILLGQLLNYFSSYNYDFSKVLGRAATGEPEIIIGAGRWRVEVADTAWKRAQGLSGRKNLPADQGMLFIFNERGNHRFWMKDMNFPIDIVWIAGERVAGISENLQPMSFVNLKMYGPPEPVDKVLEINAGQAREAGIEMGDEVSYQPYKIQ